MVPQPCKQAEDSPSTKFRKNGKKYTGIKEVLKDTKEFYGNIFSKRTRPHGVSIEKFLKQKMRKPTRK